MTLIAIVIGLPMVFIGGFLCGMACQWRCETEPNGYSGPNAARK